MTEIPLTITDAAAAIRDGRLTSVKLTEALLAKADRLDPVLGVYITRMDVSALAAAKQADADFADGIDKGPLQGIPLGVKDIIAAKGGPTTAQSQILDPWWGNNIDAPVVARLREAGAVIMGKATTAEFASGPPDPTKPFPVYHNPWDLERFPGGSSSGTGVGIAAGLFLGGLGTDTGGSIRYPAALCGISGIKATFGRVPKSGCTNLAYSMDHIGPMARSTRDCAIMLKVLAGFDPSDLTCADEPVDDYPAYLDGSLKGVRVAVERAHHFGHPAEDPEIRDVFEAAVKVLADAGAEVTEVSIPDYDAILAAGIPTTRSESYPVQALDLRYRRHLYGIHTGRSLGMGSMITGWHYVQSQRMRAHGKKVVANLMKDFDVIISPSIGCGAPLQSEMDAEALSKLPLYTWFWNVVGLPALSVPMGFNNLGLPLSLQIASKAFDEVSALKVGDAYQQLTNWHLMVPPIAQEVPA